MDNLRVDAAKDITYRTPRCYIITWLIATWLTITLSRSHTVLHIWCQVTINNKCYRYIYMAQPSVTFHIILFSLTNYWTTWENIFPLSSQHLKARKESRIIILWHTNCLFQYGPNISEAKKIYISLNMLRFILYNLPASERDWVYSSRHAGLGQGEA